MKFTTTPVLGVSLIELEPIHDERGCFARVFAVDEMESEGLLNRIVHINISANPARGTLRGMHWQGEPRPDPKIVRCTAGAIFDVAVDVRADSPTYLSWTGHRLDATNARALHIPGGCAHGFLTLEPDTEVLYLMGAEFEPGLACGMRWDDPTVDIDWPEPPQLMSERDASYPDLLR